MIYDFSGHFIEACDCFELCPCWVDDQPDEGHCTGLVAWQIEEGYVRDEPVGGLGVVAVTSHGPRRRDTRATTVVFIDSEASPAQHEALEKAFSGRLVADRTDPLGVLMEVTGSVLTTQSAPIVIGPKGKGWSIRVDQEDASVVSAQGEPLFFDGGPDALTMHHTALHKELQIVGPTVAQRGDELRISVPALRGGGYVEVEARSGMRGKFRYQHSSSDTSN